MADYVPEGIAQETKEYGPKIPAFNNDVNQFGTFDYLKGYANKIQLDLIRVAKCYNGREVRIFTPKNTERCPHCTNLITGARILSDCPVCKGTGRVGGWDVVGDFYCYGDIGSKYNVATPNGNSTSEGAGRDQLILVGCPKLLKDQDLIIFKGNKDVYKIYDVEPFMVAMQGEIIAQICSAANLTPGSDECKLADW